MGRPNYKQLLSQTTRDFKETLWDFVTGQSWRGMVFIISATLIVGTVGFFIVGAPHVNPIDALYMTVITMSTVGFGEVIPEPNAAQRLFTIAFTVIGVVVYSLSFARISAAMVEGRIQAVLGSRRMQMRIDQLKDHIILCGFGRFGQITGAEFAAKDIPVVALDVDEAVIIDAETHGLLAIVADATEEESLERAGIQRARALCCALPTDAENVYTILTARELRPDLPITALARDRKAESKLIAAGASDVISPYTIGARHMARQIMSPHVARVVDLASRGAERRKKRGVFMEELRVQAGSRLDGVTLRDSPIRQEFNVMVVALIDSDGEAIFNPGPDCTIEAGSVLVSVGADEGLLQLAIATGNAPAGSPEGDGDGE